MNKEEKERILKCVLEQIEKERAPRKRNHLRRTAAAMLAAVMILACCAFTAKVLKLDAKLENMLGGTNEQIVRSVTDINEAVEKEGLRIEAKQAVGDGHRIFILVEVTSLTDLKLDGSCNFENVEIQNDSEVGWGASFGFMEGQEISDSGKQQNYLLELTSDNEKSAGSQKITLKLENLQRTVNQGKKKAPRVRSLIKGSWELMFELEYKDVSQKYSPRQELRTGRGEVLVTRVEISPISCVIEAEALRNANALETEWNDAADVEILLNGGKTVPVWIDGVSWLNAGEDSAGTMEGVFGELIDLDQVKGICVSGQRILF